MAFESPMKRKKRRKRILGGLGGLAIGFVIFVGPWPLDQSPDDGPEKMAIEMVAKRGGELRANHEATSPQALSAGWAMEAFAFPEGIPLAGYGARLGAASTGVMKGETLAARTVYMRSGNGEESGHSIAILCADLLMVNSAISEAVTAELKAKLGSLTPKLIFTATHTHSGPGAWGDSVVEEIIAGHYDPVVEKEIVRAMSTSVIAAVEAASPASYAWIKTQAPQYLRNRTVSGADVDGTLEALVLKRKSESGAEEIAMLALFGAHATCLPDKNLKLSPDYPGRLVRTLEASTEINFAAFSAGNVGSHSPVAKGDHEVRVANLGDGLAKLLLAQLEKTEYRDSVQISTLRFELPTPKLQVRFGKSFRASTLVTGLLHEPNARLSALRLDDHLWVGVPIELSGMLSKPLRSYAKESGLSGLTISNFQGDYIGYIVPNSVYTEGSSYESEMSFLGPTGGSYFDHLLRELITTQKVVR